MCDREPSKLEMAFCLIMCAFDENAEADHKVKNCKVKQFLQKEMPMLCQGGDQQKMSEMFAQLDMDGDGKVDFQEFMTFMASFACCCHEAAIAWKAGQQCSS